MKHKYSCIHMRVYWLVGRFLGSLFYSLQRDRLERQFRNSRDKEPIEKPGKILRAEPTKRGDHFYFEQAELEVCFLSPLPATATLAYWFAVSLVVEANVPQAWAVARNMTNCI